MRRLLPGLLLSILFFLVASDAHPIHSDEPLPGTELLTLKGDRSVLMRNGFEKFLLRELEESIPRRKTSWRRDFSSRKAYERSVSENRRRLREIIGAVDPRVNIKALEYVAGTSHPAKVAENERLTVFRVRWPAFGEVFGEGLLLEPKQKTNVNIITLPDADQTPEQLSGVAKGLPARRQLALRLAEQGCRVVVPVLIDRQDTWSGHPPVAMTNQPHREWIYRQAFTMGRHPIGYEVQKVLSVVDWFRTEYGQAARIGVAGYAEGGLIAFYSAAIDPQIDAVLVSGYFDSRQRVFEEPIYRNLFGLLREFGDAEIASLIAPRPLVVEASNTPVIEGPRETRAGRRGVAAPGEWKTPDIVSVQKEVERAKALFPCDKTVQLDLQLIANPQTGAIEFGSEAALTAFLNGLGAPAGKLSGAAPLKTTPGWRRQPQQRQRRQVEQLVRHNQQLLRNSFRVREKFWEKVKPTPDLQQWQKQTDEFREYLWEKIVGRFPPPTSEINPRTRKIYDRPKWTGYEVLLDIYPDVFCWGYLLIPKDLKPGERRPVVVCQHGLEGVPADTITRDPKIRASQIYKGFSAQLADRGFVVYAPHNFYRGGNEFRRLQRMAHPLGKTLFGLTTIQHGRLLEWLGSLPFVDQNRIGFYGLSYGGNTAMRVPALLPQYAVVICSGDFNEWIYKNVTIDHIYSMIYYNVWEVFEWNLGHTFNHGDLAALIAPRPFMVERGHDDGVARDEWVAAEYARVRRLYAKLGIPEKTEIEFFDGPHAIHGERTFSFLHRQLNFPVR